MKPALALGLAMVLGLAACQTLVQLRTDENRGKALFAQQCAACHREDGRGRGPETFGLGAVPPDLTQFTKQNGGVFPRDHIMSVIDGYYRKEHVFDPMPVFGEGDLGPTVIVGDDDDATAVPADLLALANFLESIQEQ